MKRFLPAGERCELFSRLYRNSNYMISRVCTLIALIFFVSSSVCAQKSAKSLKHFQIGDKISKNFVLGTSLEDSTKVITMDDYRGKAVILDFWATYCATCIAKFPLVDSLNKIYNKNLEVILVHVSPSRETRGTVQKFMNNFRSKNQDFNLPVIMIDEMARQKFYVATIPHYVWIDANGRIQAITYSSELTDHNIQEFVAGRTLKLKQKTK